ncbi:MAG TPA: hypothetical protein VF904_12875 [Anaeromyxobacteraceae bacterium]
MPVLAPVLAALALAAAPRLPYPAPRLLQPTEKTKCDMGEVLVIEPAKGELKMKTPAGIVTYKAGPDVQVFDKDGKPVGSISTLAPGQKARVYYVVDDGARAGEIDLE